MRTILYAKADLKKVRVKDHVFVSSLFCDCEECKRYGCAYKPVVFIKPRYMFIRGEELLEPSDAGVKPPPGTVADENMDDDTDNAMDDDDAMDDTGDVNPANNDTTDRCDAPDKFRGPDRFGAPERSGASGRFAAPAKFAAPARIAAPARLAAPERFAAHVEYVIPAIIDDYSSDDSDMFDVPDIEHDRHTHTFRDLLKNIFLYVKHDVFH